MAGVSHPVSGIDHLLAMVAVGLWAAQQKGRARWVLPAPLSAAC
ncbi:HupE/UreJ family protein [Pseudomonas sp. PCH446]